MLVCAVITLDVRIDLVLVLLGAHRFVSLTVALLQKVLAFA